MLDRIPIQTNKVPYRAQVVLGSGVYTMELHYNSVMDSFVLQLYRGEEMVCAGERVVYGRALWGDVYQPGAYPPVRILPLDESGAVDVVTKETFGKLVFLTIDDGGGA